MTNHIKRDNRNTNGMQVIKKLFALINQYRNVPLLGLIVGVVDEGFDVKGQRLTKSWIARKTGMTPTSIVRFYKQSKKGEL